MNGPDAEELHAAADRGMLFAYWAERLGDDVALVSGAGNRTFAELNANANRLVRVLRARGVRAGDGIAVTTRPKRPVVMGRT